MYTMITTPLLDPFICTLRNKGSKWALKIFFDREIMKEKILPWG
jgi:hypothetical protein